MGTLQQLSSELKSEYDTTKKFFERFPDDKKDYAPHEKSMSLMHLASHIDEVFGWPAFMLATSDLDFADPGMEPKKTDSRESLLSALDENLEASEKALKAATEADLEKEWSISNNGQLLAKWSKYGAIRHALNQITHHRAQLGVYYRLLGIELPPSYGPTADDQNF